MDEKIGANRHNRAARCSGPQQVAGIRAENNAAGAAQRLNADEADKAETAGVVADLQFAVDRHAAAYGYAREAGERERVAAADRHAAYGIRTAAVRHRGAIVDYHVIAGARKMVGAVGRVEPVVNR